MGTFVNAASVKDFEATSKMKVIIQGHEIMLARVGGSFYAVNNRCAHMGGDLSAGKLEGTIITCPRPGSQYDITDGHNVRWLSSGFLNAMLKSINSTPKPIRSYKVQVLGENIMVEI
jgi:3-phenylpropionate/trans-cinnamate dioxygenase ferredoxin component